LSISHNFIAAALALGVDRECNLRTPILPPFIDKKNTLVRKEKKQQIQNSTEFLHIKWRTIAN
jgi:hypothetical protein